ncbi:RNA polymerase sigma-70 factor (ECF subfamily) [Laceyella sediminis]|uniref:RNA polymerase sigma-70 factor (ECF subfamily) n=1 Tax=Laceyella sediminis TaxID=573074 RepID=A0ABX5ERV8_9BACL|nr:RNA polymerase sigma-70 factor [Laceyella sediminis]PRZ15992.1 RNA polymerase sigma-70 factor (ECF subfamily) [Laceyella sediminis]
METEKLYAETKPLLISLAYRMLGSMMDAEDIVQEAFISLNEIPSAHVRNPKSYLCKIVTHRCIDLLKSARKQREVYVGPWLPEPIITDRNPDELSEQYVQKETISTAYLLLLQQLSWTERVVFLLREVLQFDYDEIAEIVNKSSVNCRQIFSRAKRSIHGVPANGGEMHEKAGTVVEQFIQALSIGNVNQLLDLLSTDVTLITDGGGKVRAAIHPILGMDRIIRFFAGTLPKVPAGASFQMRNVNGQPGIVALDGNQVFCVLSFHMQEERIKAIYMVVNPDKLMAVQKEIQGLA